MDDGLLLNFEVSNTPGIAIPKKEYKGRWRERAASRKWDRIQASRALQNDTSVEPASSVSALTQAPPAPAPSERPLKRKRSQASSANATPVGPKKTSNLFTGLEHEEVTEEIPSAPTVATNAPSSGEFDSLGITPNISLLLKPLSITTPTQIQKLAIPHLLNSTRDTFLRAQTGSGKTLAYLLPILQILYSLPGEKKYDRTSGCFALILVPTRELAKQIENVLTNLTKGSWLVPGWLLGGERKKSEKARLRKGVNILVGTPGRVADHLETTMAFDTSLVRWIVLDEGDRLVDMGFLETVGKILRIVEGRAENRLRKERGPRQLPERVVKILCSATLKGEEGLGALDTIIDPVFFRAEEEDVDVVFTPGQLTQKAVVLPVKLRLVSLIALITSFAKRSPPAKMIIFFCCTGSIDFHFQLLSCYNFDLHLFQLHGNLEQPVRTATMKTFSATKQRAVLLATDVASRGLDLPFVDMILQYDPPVTRDDYIHRVGRTARAGRSGEGILFLLPSEEEYINSLTSHGAQIEKISYESILKNLGKDWMNVATAHQLQAEKWVLSDIEVPSHFFQLLI